MSSAGATPSLAPLLARLLGSTEFAALETSLRRDGAAALIHVPHAAKGELVAGLAPDAVAVLNEDDPLVLDSGETLAPVEVAYGVSFSGSMNFYMDFRPITRS